MLGKAAAQRFLKPLLLGVDPARHFEIELTGAVVEPAPFLLRAGKITVTNDKRFDLTLLRKGHGAGCLRSC
jgi:hypothetical protein